MSGLTLRPYQEKAVSYAVDMLFERGNSLIVAGTGAGKTIMMSAAIGRYAVGFYAKHGRRPQVLVLAHRTEIHEQNRTKFEKVCPTLPSSEITAQRKSLHGNVHFGMVQTVSNIINELRLANCFFDLIVIDEAHHAAALTYENIIAENRAGKPEAALLGVTATPNRGDKLPLIKLFDNYIQITTRFLIESHYLVRPEFIDLTPTFETDSGTERGHLSKNVKFDIGGTQLLKKMLNDYLKVKKRGKTVIFVSSHKFGSFIYDELNGMGRNPAYLSSGLDDETRKSELKRFEDDPECEELINVDICTEGYDFPELRNIVDFDTNGTHGQWVQKVGRVLRTAPGKTGCTVIDFGGNILLYPEGVETDVCLDGTVKKPKGEHLTEEDLYRRKGEKSELTADYSFESEKKYTPYQPPDGFESLLDDEMGIVFAACTEERDSVIVSAGEKYTIFFSDKENLIKGLTGDFAQCADTALEYLGKVKRPEEKPITKAQIRLLSPEYATTALDFYGANCCICFKTWKGEIKKCLSKNAK